MTPEQPAKLFAEITQADSLTARRLGGTLLHRVKVANGTKRAFAATHKV
jgi:hypothetical protein